MAEDGGEKSKKGWLRSIFKTVGKAILFGVAGYFLVNIPLDYFFEAIRLPFFHSADNPLAQAMIHKATELGGWVNDLYGLTGDGPMNTFWNNVLADEVALYSTPSASELGNAFSNSSSLPAVAAANAAAMPSGAIPNPSDAFEFEYDPDAAFAPQA